MNKQIFSVLVIAIFLTGCSSAERTRKPEPQINLSLAQHLSDNEQKAVSPVDVPIKTIEIQPQNLPSQPDHQESSSKIEEETPPLDPEKENDMGFVFAKNDFGGLLEDSFVRLTIYPQGQPDQKMTLNIGDAENIPAFSWEVRQVPPGYFFLELKKGVYKISQISIPVGSSTATENIEIIFEVFPGYATYIGTLDLIGTREKIKLGGVPLIKPGFDYTVNILDEEQEAEAVYQKKFPEGQFLFKKQLMLPSPTNS